MRKLLAIAILISFVAPASAGTFIGDVATKMGGTVTNTPPTDQQTKRSKPFWDQVVREQQIKERQKQLDNAQAQSDRSRATAADSQDQVRNAKDAVRKMLDLQAQTNRGCIGCR